MLCGENTIFHNGSYPELRCFPGNPEGKSKRKKQGRENQSLTCQILAFLGKASVSDGGNIDL